MSIKTAIASHLKHEPIVAQRVGAHVYLNVSPTNAPLPRITIQRIGDGHTRHMTAVVGLAQTSAQISAWADDPVEADAVADVIRRTFDHREHLDIGLAPNNATLQASFLENSFDDFERDTHGDTPKVFVVHQSWLFWHTETVPTFV